jgi:uncharacterized protein (TIGR02145 family)
MNGSLSVVSNPLPGVPTMGGGGTQCGGTKDITASAGSGGNGIRWTDNSSTVSPRSVGTGTYYAVTTSAAGCESGTASVAVTINTVPTISRSGGAASQSVILGTAISAISYTASASATFAKTGNFPAGVNVSADGSSSYTISGTPSATGTFGYSLTASANGCTSAAAAGTLTVARILTTPTGGPNTAYTTTTWITGTGSSAQTWSDRIVMAVCTNNNTFTTENSTTAEYKISAGLYYYSWTCVSNNRTTLCPSGWHVPTDADFSTLITNLGGNNQAARDVIIAAWGYGGAVTGNSMDNVSTYGYYWTTSVYDSYYAYYLYYYSDTMGIPGHSKYRGFQVRCVK